jgi:predicted AAA+ superfamily ATPase
MERKLRRYYPVVVSPDLTFREDELSRSRVFEWAVVNQLRAEFFWRDPYKYEVDVVLKGRRPLPVEIKRGRVELDGLLRFMARFGVPEGYVLTPEREETRKIDGRKVLIQPAFKFLLRRRDLRGSRGRS